MILRIATYNLQEGGGALDEPVLPSRWNQQIVMLREWNLDLLLVQFTDRLRSSLVTDLRLYRAVHVNDESRARIRHPVGPSHKRSGKPVALSVHVGDRSRGRVSDAVDWLVQFGARTRLAPA